ncbi:MAG: hypothetical protein AB1564_02625 [Chloroflexota bacterium]
MSISAPARVVFNTLPVSFVLGSSAIAGGVAVIALIIVLLYLLFSRGLIIHAWKAVVNVKNQWKERNSRRACMSRLDFFDGNDTMNADCARQKISMVALPRAIPCSSDEFELRRRKLNGLKGYRQNYRRGFSPPVRFV